MNLDWPPITGNRLLGEKSTFQTCNTSGSLKKLSKSKAHEIFMRNLFEHKVRSTMHHGIPSAT